MPPDPRRPLDTMYDERTSRLMPYTTVVSLFKEFLFFYEFLLHGKIHKKKPQKKEKEIHKKK